MGLPRQLILYVSSSNSVGIQCSLGNDEFIDLERTIGRLRIDRGVARVYARTYLARTKHLEQQQEQDSNDGLPDFVTGNDEEILNVEDAYAPSSQESSWCSGFSDREEGDYAVLGVGIKVVIGKIPEHWTAERVTEWLVTRCSKGLGGKSNFNFAVVKNRRAAVFANSWQDALDIKACFHRSLAAGYAVSVKIEDDRFEDASDDSDEQVQYDIQDRPVGQVMSEWEATSTSDAQEILEKGDFVELLGLTSDKGKMLNGEVGEVFHVPEDPAGRVQVEVGAGTLKFKRDSLLIVAKHN